MKKHKKQSKKRGFSLIELLIVVAIILIIAAIAIPNLLRSRIAANEASAVGSLRTLNTAEITYNTTYPASGFACGLGALAPPSGSASPTSSAAGLIDSNLSGGSKSGYSFGISNCSGTPANTYSTGAQPLTPGTTGQRFFCSDSSGVIKYDAASVASCASGNQPI
ncbi:MAG: prepilin-type N-terminal cleavage/methylation domain-containing protein [Terriglobales bacterium]